MKRKKEWALSTKKKAKKSRMIEKIIENFAICSSFEELNLEPKPGLVTPTSKGSHKDMDYEIMKAGIESLVGYYSEAFSYGFLGESFNSLRRLGLLFEREMYKKTSGINTHLGSIFSLGILVFLVGRIKRKCFVINSENFHELIKKELESDEFSVLLKEGNFGARAEVISGYKNSFKYLDFDLTTRLLYLIQNVSDTNVIRRGGEKNAEEFKKLAAQAIESGDLTEISKFAIEKNISPGGAADILINSIFIEKVLDFEQERRENYFKEKLSHNDEMFEKTTGRSVVVLSLVVPGIEKDMKFFREFFEREYAKLKKFLNLEAEEIIFSKFGYYGIFPIYKSEKELEDLKRKTVEIEKTGLIDIDIYFEGKPISRRDIGSPERRCLICENRAKDCYVSNAHGKSELLDRAITIMRNSQI